MTANSGIISQYFTCYCNNVIAMYIHGRQGFVQCDIRAAIDSLNTYLCVTLVHSGTNLRFCRPTNVI